MAVGQSKSFIITIIILAEMEESKNIHIVRLQENMWKHKHNLCIHIHVSYTLLIFAFTFIRIWGMFACMFTYTVYDCTHYKINKWKFPWFNELSLYSTYTCIYHVISTECKANLFWYLVVCCNNMTIFFAKMKGKRGQHTFGDTAGDLRWVCEALLSLLSISAIW